MIHVRSHFAKLSEKHGDWGFKTLCGKVVEKKETTTSPSERKQNCNLCLRSFIMKKESEIAKLKILLKEGSSY